ncbi:hypothetical protein H2O64_17275 [Kordia sp. YSTF-M3]|uniref:DUF6161 domain-containing protein n=1 Tax=Kordia aestuariivivens TaxID=2759037 RepID=A0ABR7QCZ5_9FLAO|nr:DUF6161 domain-containing protein [Kordia aestuariivivens]MBC8756429.1 hypothetical protein [Kordia aestuariivivens]
MDLINDYITLEELKEKINTLPAEKQEHLKMFGATANYPQANVYKELKGFINLYRFVLKQYKGWDSQEDLNGYFETSKLYFHEILKLFNKFIDNNFRENKDRFNNNGDTATAGIIMLRQKSYNDEYIFTYDAAATEFLTNLHKRDESKVHKAASYLAGEKIENLDSDDFFFLQELYEFRRNENDYIKRSEAEKKSLQVLRSEFESYIEKVEHKLTSFDGRSTEKFEGWFRTERQDYDRWITKTQKAFQTFDEKSKQTITDKEELYDKKLQLSAPTEYWSKRAIQLRKEGNKWLYWLIGCSVIAITLLTLILYFISDGTLKELYEKTGLAIRWSIVFITLISFLAFGIRTFTKLMFSSYHLASDAEERKQLTYVYLALKQDKNIDEKERHLVLQSLFSRSDSGLLKSDTSPTMPGGILEKITK